MSAPENLPIIFRKSEGQITAVFPTLPHDSQGRYMTCYAHIGQHGACSLAWYQRTRAGKPHEYADLLRELKGIYGTSIMPSEPVFNLVVYKRMTPQHRAAFRAESRRLESVS